MGDKCQAVRRVVGAMAMLICVQGSLAGQVASLPSLSSPRTGPSPEVQVDDAAKAFAARRVTVDVSNVPLQAALEAIAAKAELTLLHGQTVFDGTGNVTVRVSNVTVEHAFAAALHGSGVRVVFDRSGKVIVTRSSGATVTQLVQSGIVGTVLNAKTKQPLRDATIALDDANKGTTSASDGTFRLANVVPGTHTLRVRLIGYVKATQTVTVVEGQTVSVTVGLEPSVNALDQVVVTGTVIPTELKAVPSAITVITAKQIEERGITRIDQLFRGDVPGLFVLNVGPNVLTPLDQVTMFSRGASALSTASAGVSQTAGGVSNPIKTYIDGVELADPAYLSQIDPRSIERIEILAGPQASTIYGSGAINGVMQIFTKRGLSATPQLTLNLLSGWVENNFSSAKTPQHDYTAQVNGVEGRLSYNAGGSWQYMGAWTPAKQTARTGGFGGARLDLSSPIGRVTADVTIRRTITENRQQGSGTQTTTDYQGAGWYNTVYNNGRSSPLTYSLVGQTLGLELQYAPAAWWTQEFGIGQDAANTERRVTARAYTFPSDTTLNLTQTNSDRRSIHYATTVRVPVTSLAQATVTAGADAWQNLTSSLLVQPQTLTGPLTGYTSVSRQPGHNTGAFVQTQLGIKNQLFFTYGLRTEWNPNFGTAGQPNYAPRYGVAYTQELGPLTAKLRGSYGRSTRPPAPGLTVGHTAAEVYGSSILDYYENFDKYVANPELGPEFQRGGEGGLELYFGSRGSLVVTRYNQTVEGLISSVKVDSVDLLPAIRNLFGVGEWDPSNILYSEQYLNVGRIRNQGWEMQASMSVGPLTTRGTYSWTKSRSLGINPKYRAQFPAEFFPQFQPGATFQFLPEHTWALGVTYAQAQTSVALNVTGVGRIVNYGDALFFRGLSSSIRLPQQRLRMNSDGYVSFNNSYALADLTASRRVGAHVEGVLQVQNLMDRYTNDWEGDYATLGRQVKIGARMRL